MAKTSRPLKVYSWIGTRQAAGRQSRELMAASSQAEVIRLVGGTRAAFFRLGETRNELDLAVVADNPRTLFWAPINRATSVSDFTKVEPE